MFEECLYFNTNALARTVSRIWTEAYKPFGLSPPHAFMLRLVLAKPGLMPRELAEELSLSRSTVTRFLDSLEERGFLSRKMANEDGREIKIYPTRAALKIHKELDQTGRKLTRLMGNTVGEEDLSRTISNLRKFQNILETK
ncbi:MAG: MarR family transcriptional regulator [Gammaproteobacteria bacterium]|nr:MarR family transcriptional regulator [Gammaproteobacteria bacterium]